MNLKFPADITADDYYRAELLHQGWTRILSSIIFVVAMIFLISTNICSWRGWKDLLPILILVALLVYVCWRASAFGIKRRIRKIYLQQKSLQISRELTLADESLITRSPSAVNGKYLGAISCGGRQMRKWPSFIPPGMSTTSSRGDGFPPMPVSRSSRNCCAGKSGRRERPENRRILLSQRRAKKALFSLRNHTCIKHVTPYSVSSEDSEFA